MIQFPCPKSILSMTPVDGGYYCGYCKSEVRDLTHLSEEDLSKWKTENSSQCVVMNEPNFTESKSSLSYFALALLLVGGASLFNIADAQVESNIVEAGKELSVPKDPSLGLLRVNLVNQFDNPTWGAVWVELPNGKELEMYEMEEGKFYVEIPSYCKGKELVVYAEHLGKKKHVTTVMYRVGEEVEVKIQFKADQRYKGVVMGYF